MFLSIYHPAEGMGHDSSVALIGRDGKILAAVSEERLTRIKMDGGFPFRALESVRKIYPFKPSDLEAVAVPYWNVRDKARDLGHAMMWSLRRPQAAPGWMAQRFAPDPFHQGMNALGAYRYVTEYAKQIEEVRQRDRRPKLEGWRSFLQHEGFGRLPVVRVDHHVAHAASAYYASGWQDALILTADGAGAMKSSLAAAGRRGKLQVIARTFLPNSPGRFWEVITHLCGFHHHKHGGKITGLAASGDRDAPCYDVMRQVLWADGMTVGSRIDPLRMAHALDSVPREDLAATAQRRLEEVLCEVARHAVRRTGLRRVALSGGVFSNVLLNQKIFELPEVDDVFIFPAMGDEGLSAGAGLWACARRQPLEPYRLADVYLGPQYPAQEMESALQKGGLQYERLDEEAMVQRVVESLMHRKVVAYYEGRMEYGPRALGHRSILYGTQDASVNDWLNKKLHRSEFMPFAPVTLEEQAGNCYEGIPAGHHAANFMTLTYQCTAKMKQQSPAVVHRDGTARPQLVNPSHGRYYQIVRRYYEKTGIPSLVNTSFNMHEEPIVCTPDDAVRGFVDGGLDALVLGPFWAVKK